MSAGYNPSCEDGHKGPFERVELIGLNAYDVEEVVGVMARCSACGWSQHVSVMETASGPFNGT
jgi:hypothetical protein